MKTLTTGRMRLVGRDDGIKVRGRTSCICVFWLLSSFLLSAWWFFSVDAAVDALAFARLVSTMALTIRRWGSRCGVGSGEGTEGIGVDTAHCSALAPIVVDAQLDVLKE